jgi:hypothetical protein
MSLIIPGSTQANPVRMTAHQAHGLISDRTLYNDGSADVRVPCTCGMLPLVNTHDPDTGDLIKVSDTPDCILCGDTGWYFSHCELVSPLADLTNPVRASYPARTILAGPASHNTPTSSIAA